MTIILTNRAGNYTREAKTLASAETIIRDAMKNDGVYNAGVRDENGKVVAVAERKVFGKVVFSLIK